MDRQQIGAEPYMDQTSPSSKMMYGIVAISIFLIFKIMVSPTEKAKELIQ